MHFHEKTWNRPSGVCGREYSLVVDGGVDAAQFKQQLVHPALGQLAHDEQTVAGGRLPECCRLPGMPQAAETAEAPAGASAPKAAVRLAGTGVPGAAGMPAGTAGRMRLRRAYCGTSKRESARSAVSAGMQPVLSFEIQRR